MTTDQVPAVWWSPSLGLIEKLPACLPGEPPRLVRTRNRHATELPADAIRLTADATDPAVDRAAIARIIHDAVCICEGQHELQPDDLASAAALVTAGYRRTGTPLTRTALESIVRDAHDWMFPGFDHTALTGAVVDSLVVGGVGRETPSTGAVQGG